MLFKVIRNLIGKIWLYTLLLGVALAATRAMLPNVGSGIFCLVSAGLGILLCYLLRMDLRRFRHTPRRYTKKDERNGLHSHRIAMIVFTFLMSFSSLISFVSYVDKKMDVTIIYSSPSRSLLFATMALLGGSLLVALIGWDAGLVSNKIMASNKEQCVVKLHRKSRKKKKQK